MAVFNEPTKWAQTLGKDADVVKIPDIAGDTDPSIDKIFPAVFSIPLARGGRAIPRSVLNGLFKLLGDWVYYIQNGGIASYSAIFDYAIGRVVSYNGNIYKCIQANGASSTVVAPDSGTEYWQRLDGAIGEIKYFAFNTPPDGYLVCNGAKVSRTTYADLFAVIGTTFGEGDGSTTFNIPDLRDRYIIGANANALGTQIAEQLPNIRGELKSIASDYTGPTAPAGEGAFFNEGLSKLGVIGSGTWIYKSRFDASLSNSIYRDSGHVYPLSLALLPCIKY